jgi:hypothetical protein
MSEKIALGLPFIAPFVVMSSIASANNRNASAGYYDYPEYAFFRVRADEAGEIHQVLSARNDPTQDQQKKITCTPSTCAFLISRTGRIFPVQNTNALNTESTKLEQRGNLEKGNIALSKQDTKTKNLEVTVEGMAARFLFTFLDQDSEKSSPYDIKVEGLRCSHEPVSNTYECGFKVAENGTISP